MVTNLLSYDQSMDEAFKIGLELFQAQINTFELAIEQLEYAHTFSCSMNLPGLFGRKPCPACGVIALMTPKLKELKETYAEFKEAIGQVEVEHANSQPK